MTRKAEKGSGDRPIPFLPPMIRAILEGRKSQTRRVIKVPKPYDYGDDGIDVLVATGHITCPYGVPGDRLWVREKFKPVASGQIRGGKGQVRYGIAYDADDAVFWSEKTTLVHTLSVHNGDPMQFHNEPWKSSRYMRKSDSRITLEVTDVRVERVQEISRGDAKAEGFLPGTNGLERFDGKLYGNAELAFRACWDSINAKRGFGWEVNPWCWCVSFRRIEQGEGKG